MVVAIQRYGHFICFERADDGKTNGLVHNVSQLHCLYPVGQWFSCDNEQDRMPNCSSAYGLWGKIRRRVIECRRYSIQNDKMFI